MITYCILSWKKQGGSMKSKKYISFKTRLNAFELDIAFAAIMYLIIYFAYITRLPVFEAPAAVTASFWGIVVFFFMFNVLFKGSPAYKIFGFVIRNAKTGEPASSLRILARCFGFVLSWFSLFIGFFSSLFRKNRMTLHDCMASTIVTYRNYEHDPETAVQKPTPFNAVINILSLLIAVFVIYHVYLLFFDEPMTDYTKSMLVSDYHEKNPEENGFYYSFGFTADPEADQFMEGREFVDVVNRNAMESMRNFEMKPPPVKPEIPMFDLEEAEEIGIIKSGDEDQFKTLKQNEKRIRELESKYAFMDAQINAIVSKKIFEPTIVKESNLLFPQRMNFVSYYRLKMAVARLEYVNGNYDKAVDILQKSDKDVRYMLENTPWMRGKLIYQICSTMVLSTYSDMASYKMTNELYDAVQAIPEFTAKEKSMEKALKFEARFFTQRYSFLSYISGRTGVLKLTLLSLSAIFQKENFLINLKNDFYKRIEELSVVDEKRFYEMIREEHPEINISYKDKVRYLFLNAELITQGYMLDSYAARLQTLAGFVDLLKVKADILKNKIKEDKIQEYLNDSAIKNPFTGNPIHWNSELKELEYNLEDMGTDIHFHEKVSLYN